MGKEDEVLLRARLSDGGAGRVKMEVRGRAVEVEINPNNGGACTYRHVGYYKRTEEGRG